MEVRELKKWLIDNNLDNDELYQESLKCYQVEAYKAAYIFSYLANHKYIAKLAIDYKGIPTNFMSKCSDENKRIADWQKCIDSLKDEDMWEKTVNDNLIKAKEEDNIFKLPSKIKEKYSHMRVLRNNAAHAKDRKISESTVIELWNEIEYTLPYFEINGTVEAWLDELDKKIKYLDSEFPCIEDLLTKFNNYSIENKTVIVKRVIEKYLVGSDWNADCPNVVTVFLSDVFQNKKGEKQIGNGLSSKEEIYLFICIGKYEFQHEIIDLFTDFDTLKGINQFRYFCKEFSNNFWKFIDKIYDKVNHDKLLSTVIYLLKQNKSELLGSDFSESKFLSTNDLFFEKALENISHLYYYTTNNTWPKHHPTPTFDYSKFHDYMHYIVYIAYRISKDPNLRKNKEVNDFIERFKKLMTNDYSEDDWCSTWLMQNEIKEINEKYKIV